METLTPKHPRWMEFYNRLSVLEHCDHTTNNAFEVLNIMGGFDIHATLNGLNHAHCDCEILLNYAPDPTAEDMREWGWSEDQIAQCLDYLKRVRDADIPPA